MSRKVKVMLKNVGKWKPPELNLVDFLLKIDLNEKKQKCVKMPIETLTNQFG